jgi:hypothetical protein
MPHHIAYSHTLPRDLFLGSTSVRNPANCVNRQHIYHPAFLSHMGAIPSNELTNSMEMSLSGEATSCAATQELPNILGKPMVHYRITRDFHWSLS